MTHFFVYDVFTDQPFSGNQLAVIPDATKLPEDDLQRIAREFNFSETTFVYPATNATMTAKVRIFTPTMEIPFAGHPTIGTAMALRDMGHDGDMVLELGVGPIPCTFAGNVASFTTSAQLETIANPDPVLVARSLGLDPAQLQLANHAPVQASLGLPFVLVEMQDQTALDACVPDVEAMREGAAKHPAGLDFAIYAYLRDGDTIHARMFAPLDNIPEDPATGSAAATLTMQLAALAGSPVSLQIVQGEAMGRRSVIAAASDGESCTISGKARRVMMGRLV